MSNITLPSPHRVTPQAELRQKTLQLEQHVQQLEQELFRVTGLLIALLRHKHQGRAFVPIQLAQDSQFLGVDNQFISPLESVRITVVDRGGKPFLIESEGVTPPEAPPPPPPDVPAPACTDDWHRDGTGRRCPNCGSTEKL